MLAEIAPEDLKSKGHTLCFTHTRSNFKHYDGGQSKGFRTLPVQTDINCLPGSMSKQHSQGRDILNRRYKKL